MRKAQGKSRSAARAALAGSTAARAELPRVDIEPASSTSLQALVGTTRA
ncbi:MAG: hypothetical protein U0610_04405 [bacterium]